MKTNIIKKSHRGYYLISIGDELFNSKRVIFFNEEVNADTAQHLISQLLTLEMQQPGEPILMYLNSPGGSCTDGLAIIDVMESLTSPVPFMDDYCVKRPNSFGAKRYQMISSSFNADKTWSSIKFIAANALQIFEFDSARKMLTSKKRFDIRKLGKEKTALFLNISDTDRSLDMLAGIFYTQALNVLCTQADRSPTSKLDVPVKLCLDDFASNAFISDFEKMMSVVRSRDISISCVVQSLSQLNAYYGEARASTIIDNADLLYYKGCQDLYSADFILHRANMPLENVLALKSNEGILFRRGEKPLKVNKIPPYSMMPKDDNEQYDFGDDNLQPEHKGTAL